MRGFTSYLYNIFGQILVWVLAFGFWFTIRNLGITESGFETQGLAFYAYLTLALGITAGILFGLVESVMADRFVYKLPLGVLVLLGAVAQLFVLSIVLSVGFLFAVSFFETEFTVDFFIAFITSESSILMVIYTFFISILVVFFKAIDQKFGPGNLYKMLSGRFYSPKQEERVFMFLDLKNSTTYAEKLGHIKYSRLIQDCFHDLSVVTKFGAEIYQYVGDEAVLTWKIDKGLKNNNCIRAFFAFDMMLKKRKAIYMRKYGLLPEFKAGLNMGMVTVAEVGRIKREIAYHGDTINVAARLEALCNEHDARILISEYLEKALEDSGKYVTKEMGTVHLKGKTVTVKIYKIDPFPSLEKEKATANLP